MYYSTFILYIFPVGVGRQSGFQQREFAKNVQLMSDTALDDKLHCTGNIL